MSNETEKLTINLGVVELAQIDVLVEQGIYSNRSDFIRTAIRKDLELHRDKIEFQLEPVPGQKKLTKTIGILVINQKSLEKLLDTHDKLNISVIGMLIIDNSISTELFEKTVENVLVHGKLVASKDIRKLIDNMN